MTASPGTIYYTLDGVTDPRLIGGGVNPAAMTYSDAVSLAGTVTVKARLLSSSGGWSGLVEATFNVQGVTGDFDGDGDVDGRDFMIWQRGGSPAPLSSNDLTDWQGNYGAVAPLVVEEVSSLVVNDTTSTGWWLAPLADAFAAEPLGDAVTEEYFEEVGSDGPALGSPLAIATDISNGEFVPHYAEEEFELEEFDAVFAEWEVALTGV
jgi:hypothetical protein